MRQRSFVTLATLATLATRATLATLILTGCTVSHEPSGQPPEGPVTSTPVLLVGEEEQGTFLLGNIADGLARDGKHVSVAAPMGQALSVVGQGVVYNGRSGSALVGVVLPESGPRGRQLRIDAVNAFGPGYTVSYWDPVLATWNAYCDPAESPYAIAMLGEWTITGLHNPGAMVTFACQVSGKAAECDAWGYTPESAAGSHPGMRGWDLNQACTQMARANYCMDGISHTREKTPILIRDFIPAAEPPNSGSTELQLTPPTYPPVPPPPDQYYYEAVWKPTQVIKCLNHARWNDLKLGGPCPPFLQDPRVDPNAHFCEDPGLHLDLDDRTLINASKTMDLALHRWTNGSGDTLTTAHGYVVDEGTSKRKTVPPAGFNGPPLSDEGYLLRNLTGVLTDPLDAYKVFRLHGPGGDTVLGPSGMLTGYTYADPQDSRDSPDFEGYLLIAPGVGPGGGRKGFYLYQSGTDYVTATQWPGAGYQKVGGPTAPPIGYVIADPL